MVDSLINKNNKVFKDWRYYNHAVIPNTAPNIAPDLKPLYDGSIWNIDGKFPLFARWTTDFDWKEKTDWYYLVKDTLYEPEKLNKKKRYNINRGRKHFEIKIINPCNYSKELYDVLKDSFESYPSIYRPILNKEKIIYGIKSGEWNNLIVFAAFEKSTNKIGGFTTIAINGKRIETLTQKATKIGEKNRVNYALVDGYLLYFNEKIKNGYYICGGERNLVHKTNWHEIKIDYFGFRKAYCKLNIAYRPILRPIVFILYLFRRTINHLKNKSSLLYKINAVLEMETIARKCKAME